MSHPPAQASLPAGFLSHASLQRSEANRSEGQGQLLTEGGVLEETSHKEGLCGVAGPHPCCTGSPAQKGTGTCYMADKSRSLPVRPGSSHGATCGHWKVLSPPLLFSSSMRLIWVLGPPVVGHLHFRAQDGGGVVSPRQLPAAPHPCPNLCPLFSTRLGCFFCPISRWFSPTFSVKSLQQSPSLVSEEPWAQGWSGLGQEKAGLRGQMERGTQLGTQ